MLVNEWGAGWSLTSAAATNNTRCVNNKNVGRWMDKGRTKC